MLPDVIEIIAIAMLTGRLKAAATSKGRSAWWAALLPVLWIAGELCAAVACGLVGLDGFALYLGALVGAAIGGGVAYAIVSSLSPDPLWDNDAPQFHDDGIHGGHHDPNNPYNAPRA